MTSPTPTLTSLLAPIGVDRFFAEYWENAHLHVSRSDPAYFGEILSLADLDEYLSRNDLRYPSLRMIKSGKAVPLADFSRPLRFGDYSADGLVDVDRVYAQYNAGASLVLQLMRSSISSVSSFANLLQGEMKSNVETTIYVTPPGEQGFTTHYDTHSVIVLQVAGRKRWRLYDFTRRLPLLTDTFDKVSYTSTPATADIILQPGDTLYVPRGLAHDATSTPDDKSVHITVGLFPTMWRDMFETQIATLDERVEFRHSPVSYFLPGHEAEFATEKQKMCRSAFAGASPRDIRNQIQRKDVNFQSRMTHGWMAQDALVRAITAESRIRLRASVVHHIEHTSERVTVYFYDKKIALPQGVFPAVQRVLSGETTPIRDLQANLEEKSAVILAKKMVTAGLAEIVP